MSGFDDVMSALTAALAHSGLMPRGVIGFSAGEGPPMADGDAAAAVVLIGHAGSSFWRHFASWRGSDGDPGGPDPLDRWSKQTIVPLADAFGATAYFPSDAPYQPFQRWGMRAEGLTPSPLGILIHPVYGLWHGYRGALGFGPGRVKVSQVSHAPGAAPSVGPCAACQDKPCFSACPVQAIGGDGFAVSPCRQYLAGAAGRGTCLAEGCRARDACPVGRDYRYDQEQVRFHMAALHPV